MPRRTSALFNAALLVHAFALTFAPWAAARGERASEKHGVRGYVLTQEGGPVSKGIVVMRAGATRIETIIERTGRFHLVPQDARPHELDVIVPGLAPYRVNVFVPGSRHVDLPVIRLSAATYVRMQLVSADGEIISSPRIIRRSFSIDGSPFDTPLETATDAEGVITVGPLPRGITMLALDSPPLAQTRLTDLYVTGADAVLDAGRVILDDGAVLNVDVVDATGAAVVGHVVAIEDTRQPSPLSFAPVRTNQQGRATFERLGRGQYRVRTTAVHRCSNQILAIERVVSMQGRGTVNLRIIAGGTASFRVSTPFGPLPGAFATTSPESSASAPPSWLRSAIAGHSALPRFQLGALRSETRCAGTTDADGRITLDNFPPGPARITVRLPNSQFSHGVTIPEATREIPVEIPNGLLQVLVVDSQTKRPVTGATITWSAGAMRVEARSVASGDALLEAVSATAGVLAITAPAYERFETKLSQPPEAIVRVRLIAAPPTTVRTRISTTSGEPIANAVVELSSADPADIGHITVTDAQGVARFDGVGPGTLELAASADGFARATSRIARDRRQDAALTLGRGYRVVVSVELPPTAGRQLLNVLTEAGVPIGDVLDLASERLVEPGGHASLGPLPPGSYIVDVFGANQRRQARIRLADADLVVTIK